jgi:hypothetical protein
MSRRSLSALVTILAVVALMWAAVPVTAQTPPQGATRPYSARLADPSGQPVTDGQYDFVFSLYGSEKDQLSLWTELRTGVPLKSGNLNLALGQSVPIPNDVLARPELWLSVSVRGPKEADFTSLEPRQRFVPSGAGPGATGPSALTCPHSHFTDSWTGANSEFGLLLENTSTGDGLRAYSKSTVWNYAAVFGANNATTGYGTGVYGYSLKGVGMRAGSDNGDGLEATTEAAGKSAVYAHSVAGYGVTARSANAFGLQVGGGGDGNSYDNVGDILLEGARGEVFATGSELILNSNGLITLHFDKAVFSVNELGNTFASGTKSAVVETADYGQRLLYTIESPEVWFEDIGRAQLVAGAATVQLDPVFAQTANLAIDYHVFVTPVCKEPAVLFVSGQSATAFTVQGVTMGNQPSNCAFDYRVAAKRLGYEGVRLAVADPIGNPADRR